MTRTRSLLRPALHVLALWALALVHPLFDLLARSPEFFVAHGFHRTEMLMFVVGLVLLGPLPLVAALWVSRLAGARALSMTLGLLVGALSGVLAAQALKLAGAHTWTVVVPGALAIGSGFTLAYFRFAALRSAMTVLSMAVAIVPIAFLARPGIRSLLSPRPDPVAGLPAVRLDSFRPVPVVLVIGDEIPLVSLLDAEGAIDAGLYPNFAALAREGRWFPNATTVSDYTTWAVPAIATGVYPVGSSLPTVADYPNNLFVLLARTHQVRAVEASTSLCPRSVCERRTVPWHERLEGFASDLRIIALHVLLPEDLRSSLPPLTGDWANFDPDGWRRERRARRAEQRAKRPDRLQIVRNFIERIERPGARPTFYYLHSLLTHWPHRLLPGGQRNATAAALPGEIRMGWSDDAWAVAQHYQRHLLTLGLFDSLLGALIQQLKAVELYDRSLLIVTSDHGIAFTPGDLRRGLTPPIAAEVMRVPLIVKLPAGMAWPPDRSANAEARNVEVIDIVPTIADVLGLELPWNVDGSSLLDPSERGRSSKRMLFASGTRTITYPADGPDSTPALDRKLALFGGADNYCRVPQIEGFHGIVGRPVAQLSVPVSGMRVMLDHAARFENIDTADAAVPFDVGGRLVPAPAAPTHVALAVNGRIHAVTRTWTSEPARFMATPPLDAWQDGYNVIDVFVVERRSGGVRLQRAQRADESGAAAPAAGRALPELASGIEGDRL